MFFETCLSKRFKSRIDKIRLTTAVLETNVGKSPDISEVHRKPNKRKQELEFLAPLLPFQRRTSHFGNESMVTIASLKTSASLKIMSEALIKSNARPQPKNML